MSIDDQCVYNWHTATNFGWAKTIKHAYVILMKITVSVTEKHLHCMYLKHRKKKLNLHLRNNHAVQSRVEDKVQNT